MVRTESAIVFDFLNTSATTQGVSLFKLGNSDSVTTQTDVWRGTGRISSSLYSYPGQRFEGAGIGLQFTFVGGGTSPLYNISGATVASLEAAATINLGGTLTISPGTGPTDNWLWTWVGPSQGILRVEFFVFAALESTISVNFVGTQESTSTGVVVGGEPGYTYVLESQVGAPIQIYALDIQCDDNAQILEPLTYTREDANGNSITHQCIPTIDPYQDQTGVILNKKVSGFCLDGDTTLSFNLRRNVNYRLILNYMSLKNADLFKGALRQELAVERMRLLGTLGPTPGQELMIS